MRRRFRNQLVLDLDRGGRRLPWAVAPDDVGLEDLQPPRIRRNQSPLTVFKSFSSRSSCARSRRRKISSSEVRLLWRVKIASYSGGCAPISTASHSGESPTDQ